MLGVVVALGYAVVGSVLVLVVSVRRFGAKGLGAAVIPVLLAVAALALRAVVTADPLDILAGLAGAAGIAVVIATKGRLERFPDRDLLSERWKGVTSDEDTLRTQWRTMGLLALLLIPLFAANWARI